MRIETYCRERQTIDQCNDTLNRTTDRNIKNTKNYRADQRDTLRDT